MTPDRVDEQAKQLAGFHKLNTDTYYREVKVEGERRFLLCFNPQLFKDQRKARRKSVEDYQSFAKNLNAQLREAKKSRQRKSTVEKFNRQLMKGKLKDFVNVQLRVLHKKVQSPDETERTIRTYQGTVEVNEEKMQQSGIFDASGCW